MQVFKRVASFSLNNFKIFGLAIIVPLLVLLLIIVPTANAAGETYGYAESGAKIVGKGGSFGNASVTFTKNPLQTQGKDTYTGSFKIKGNNGDCNIGLSIAVSPGATSGVISAPAFLNGIPGAGAGGTNYTPSCDRTFAAGVDAFNKSISVSQNNASNPAPTPDETAGQKEIIATVYSDKKVSTLPTVKIALTKLNTPSTAISKTIDWNTSANIGSVRWSNIDPGSYRICVTPDNLFSYFSACQEITKVAGTPGIVNFGSSANNLNETGKQVSVKVNLAVPPSRGVVSYGPVGITLFDSATKAPAGKTAETNTLAIGEAASVRNTGQVIVLGAKLNEVEPGTYIVCVTDNTDICSAAFTKEVNLEAKTEINISEEQSKAFLSPDTKSSCNVEGVGWIVCPVLVFMGGIVDGAYNFVSGLLVVQPLLTTGNTTGVYLTWVVMRNIANVAFVIAFLIIIFSQLTGVALSNYGVKKLLPRLVVAAILVNVSFWICAIAIDISNILGASILTVFESVDTNIRTSLSGAINTTGNLANGGQWTDMIGTVLAGTGVAAFAYYVELSALIPALLAAVVAIVTVFLVLTLRQALIILLIVVSPLAFVAYLLPNTEDLFTKWRKLFMTLLLMYPIIAGLFGASALASMIIMQGSDNMVVQIMGACIAILPLALTPLVMKTAGGLLSRFGGIVNNTERGPVDRLKKAGAGYRESRKNLRNSRALDGQKQLGRGSFVKWRARRSAITNGRQSEVSRSTTGYVADQIQNNARFQKNVAGGSLMTKPSTEALQRAEASAISAQLKLEADEVNAASAIIKNANLDLNQMQELAMGRSLSYKAPDGTAKTLQNTVNSTLQMAAIKEQFKTGDIGMTDKIISESAGFDVKQRQIISEGAQSLAGKVKYYGGMTSTLIAKGEIHNDAELNVIVKDTMEAGKISEQDLAVQDKDALTRFSQVASMDGVDNSKLIKVAQDLQKNDRIYPMVEDRKKDRITKIAEGKPF